MLSRLLFIPSFFIKSLIFTTSPLANSLYKPSFITPFDFNKGSVAYILEVVLIKDYQVNGISQQRLSNKKNTSYENYKSYLITNLWLLKIAEDKLKPFLIAFKEVLKLFLILIYINIFKLIKLFSKKIFKLIKSLFIFFK